MTLTPTRSIDPAAALAARLDDPRIATSLNTLLDHADLLALLVSGLSEFAARGDTITESLADGVREMKLTAAAAGGEAGQSIDTKALIASGAQLAKSLPKLTPALTTAIDSGIVDTLVDSGVLSPAALDQIGLMATGLVKGTENFDADPVRIRGPLSLVGLLKDPDINRALSYFATIAKAIGQQVATSTPTAK